MNNTNTHLAPEQYELHESPVYQFSINRRDFFKTLGSGLAIAFVATNSIGAALVDDKLGEDQIGAWIHIGENDRVTIFTGKVEVGQNIRTSLAQMVADELEVSINKIDMVMGDTALTPYDRGTFGSRTTPYMGPQLRKAAASARKWLIDLAAEKWNVKPDELRAQSGKVVSNKNQQSVSYGELTKGKELIKEIDDKIKTKTVDEWKMTGTSVPKVNGENFVSGKHKYVSDMKLPDMLYGKILRPPSFGATLSSVDVSAARKMKDVVVVHDDDFIGVAAPSLHTATEALKSIKANWKTKIQPSRNELFEHLVKTAENKNDNESGGLNEAFSKAKHKLELTFFIDYIAHVPLEPRAGVAHWVGNKLTVWTGTQRPFGVQEELQQAFGIPKENIRVIMPDTGSGYGGKHTGEAGIEAARLAKDASKPVKIVWTREEESTWAYFRPAGVISVKASTDDSGMVTSWNFHNYNSGGSGIETPYAVKNKKIQFYPSDSPLRQGSYRGLAATANVFAREAAMDDLALMLRMDPLAFRLKNLEEDRMKNVLIAAADKFGWATQKPVRDHGYGIACGTEKGSFVATCAEVAIDRANKQVKVIRVSVAFECGAIINPVHLENQIVGSVIQGLGGALFERIDFKDGKILNARLSQYRVPRFSDTPKLDIVMLNRKDIPSAGAGETPIVGIAPAVRNAIANVTGKKLYSLPLVPDGLNI